ncbi:hypothetical protein KC337_g14 [Hortaea werneckii]|nr:hypothetical protein KC337_g14 [Hortaea werneckii]
MHTRDIHSHVNHGAVRRLHNRLPLGSSRDHVHAVAIARAPTSATGNRPASAIALLKRTGYNDCKFSMTTWLLIRARISHKICWGVNLPRQEQKVTEALNFPCYRELSYSRCLSTWNLTHGVRSILMCAIVSMVTCYTDIEQQNLQRGGSVLTRRSLRSEHSLTGSSEAGSSDAGSSDDGSFEAGQHNNEVSVAQTSSGICGTGVPDTAHMSSTGAKRHKPVALNKHGSLGENLTR